MTTEREMLEFAAKACGIEQTGYFEVIGVQYVNGSEDSPYTDFFNPLTNSADCAAMCAKLFIDSDWYKDSIRMANPFDDNDEQHEAWEDFKDHNNDREAAWRYAATQVAAKIGGMK